MNPLVGLILFLVLIYILDLSLKFIIKHWIWVAGILVFAVIKSNLPFVKKTLKVFGRGIGILVRKSRSGIRLAAISTKDFLKDLTAAKMPPSLSQLISDKTKEVSEEFNSYISDKEKYFSYPLYAVWRKKSSWPSLK